MATDINIQSLFPALRNTQVAKPATDIFNTHLLVLTLELQQQLFQLQLLTKTTKEIIDRTNLAKSKTL
jgi:molecular chaperone DnaK